MLALLATPPTILYRQARGQIRDGDLLLFRNPRSTIARATGGIYSHAAMAVWHGPLNSRWRTLLVAEAREWRGSRLVSFSSQVRDYPGRIDVWRPTCPAFIAARASDFAVRKSGHRYAYSQVLKCGLLHLVDRLDLFSLLDPIDRPLRTAAESEWYDDNFCSWQDVYCYRKAAQIYTSDWDPCPGLADRYCEPNHLAQRGGFEPATMPGGQPITRLVHRKRDVDETDPNVLPLGAPA